MATQVETILDTLKSDMKKYIKVSRGYNTTPTTILKGSFGPDEVFRSFPVLGFDITGEDFDVRYMNQTGMCYVEIDIYGYCYSDKVDRIDDIRKLAHDVIKFIKTNWTYTDKTEITDKVEYLGYKTMTCRVPIRVWYNYSDSTIG